MKENVWFIVLAINISTLGDVITSWITECSKVHPLSYLPTAMSDAMLAQILSQLEAMQRSQQTMQAKVWQKLLPQQI